MLEHDYLSSCIRELQRLSGGHKRTEDGTVGSELLWLHQFRGSG